MYQYRSDGRLGEARDIRVRAAELHGLIEHVSPQTIQARIALRKFKQEVEEICNVILDYNVSSQQKGEPHDGRR